MSWRYQRLFFERYIPIILKNYSKLPKTPADLIVKLQYQGLGISNITSAQEFLSRVNYFRFRGYLYPYFDSPLAIAPSRQFKPNSTFEKAWEMYCFDEGLRKLIFGLLPEIEVALRTVLDATISQVAGHGFWYLEKLWFKDNNRINEVINTLQGAFGRSKEAYVEHYHNQYYNNISPKFKGMPPFWVISELATLGQLKEFFEHLKESSTGFGSTSSTAPPKSTVLDKMSHKFGAAHYRELVNWVHVLRDVRNLCAHHARLWNRNLMAPQGVHTKVSKKFLPIGATSKNPTNKVYATIVALRVMCKQQAIHDGLRDGLLALFKRFPESTTHMATMGMPSCWEDDTLWL